MGLSEDMFGQVAISPYNELIAYEFLYSRKGASLKRIVEETVAAQKLPSEVFYERFGMVTPDDLAEVDQYVETKLGSFSVAINNTPSWPDKLKDSARPTPVLYYRGDIGLMEAPNISIVGARKASTDGKRRAALLAKQLVERNVVITTGLALGIDTAATRSAIEHGGKAIGVIGTPVDVHYPKENIQLQDAISREHLLVSQVPFYRYANQPFKTKRYYFPERNELMAAISDATVIVEASDTSGTLTQAKACLHQGRPLFIMRSCAENEEVTWPSKFLSCEGVHVLDDVNQITSILGI